MELGEIYRTQKRWKECVETILLAKKSWKGKDKDSDKRIFEILGEAYFNLGDFKGVIKSMAPHFSRLSPVGKFWLARAYHASGDLSHAENAYREVLSLMKGKGSGQKEKIRTESRLYLTDILFETGRIKEAKIAYQKLLAGKPAVPIASWISYRLASIDLKKEEAEVKETKGSQMDPVWTSAISVVTKIEPVMGEGRSLSR
jgi:tetratricopeptide (TPR) repeat protein